MVRVLASGEVVSDDDPRATGSGQKRTANSSSNRNPSSSASNTNSESAGFDPSQLWETANNRLDGMGLHSFQLSGYTFPPASIVLSLFALLFLGPMAAILIVAITALAQTSFSPFAGNSASSAPSSHNNTASSQQIGRPATRRLSGVPPSVAPFFQYASQCNITASVQTLMEGLHTLELPWWAAIVGTGCILRVASAPLHIYAEKLFAKRINTSNAITQKALQRISDTYGIAVVPNASQTALELRTDDEKLKAKVTELIHNIQLMAVRDQGLTASRIQNLKMCTVPLWIFSSFALRNIIASDFHPSIPGGLWVPDLLLPDAYYVLPVAVGFFGFFNLWSQRKIYPASGSGSPLAIRAYDTILAFFTTFAVYIMTQLPACIPLYWLTVSVTGAVQTQLLRVPRIKKMLGIMPLPTDSSSPLRDLFLARRAKTL